MFLVGICGSSTSNNNSHCRTILHNIKHIFNTFMISIKINYTKFWHKHNSWIKGVNLMFPLGCIPAFIQEIGVHFCVSRRHFPTKIFNRFNIKEHIIRSIDFYTINIIYFWCHSCVITSQNVIN